MKSLIFVSVLFASQLTLAGPIAHSEDAPRHQQAIVEAITAQCGQLSYYDLVSQTSQEIKVDNGMTDVKYKSVIAGQIVYDQVLSPVVYVSVESTYTDAYDHGAKEWGSYTVESVNCNSSQE